MTTIAPIAAQERVPSDAQRRERRDERQQAIERHQSRDHHNAVADLASGKNVLQRAVGSSEAWWHGAHGRAEASCALWASRAGCDLQGAGSRRGFVGRRTHQHRKHRNDDGL